MSNETFQVVASPQTRFQLAIFLMHKDIKIKGHASRRNLWRARTALGLHAPHEAFTLYKDAVSDHKLDNKTLHRFSVSVQTAEYVTELTEKLECNPLTAEWVSDILDQLADKKDDPRAATAMDYDEERDIKRWKPSGRPLLAAPHMFAEVLGEVIAGSKSWAEFQRAYARGMSAEGPDDGEVDDDPTIVPQGEAAA